VNLPLALDQLAPPQAAAPVVVAIPARNEEDRIAACLSALADQRDAPPPLVLVLMNNCTDATRLVVQAFAATCELSVHGACVELPPPLANAGHARGLAMDRAAHFACADGVLLTTDADGRVAPDWLAANLRAIRAGADAVAGRALIDPQEAELIPAELHEADARECAYAALLDQIVSLIDPDPADPWPRHDEHSGASIAVTRGVYGRAGGMPGMPLGEDRAFFDSLRRMGARIRHAPDVWVTVSGRIEGRAEGGMADTMRRRMTAPDVMLDERVEATQAAARRARLRRAVRQACQEFACSGVAPDAAIAAALRLPTSVVRAVLANGFGEAWAELEARSPVLRRRRLPVARLAIETARARRLRAGLLRQAAADPAGIRLASPG
jgi:GT2 family glycosyltransferase